MSGTSLWRVAGMSYLQYTNKAAAAVRAALKEPLRAKAVERSNLHMAAFKYQNGVRGEKMEIDSIKKAAEAFKSA